MASDSVVDGTDNSRELFTVPVREFAQERARRTYEALLQAAFSVFADNGFDGAQTPDIAASAGVSVGTFYRYFTDKRQIFLEIMQMYLQDGQREVMSQLSVEKLAGRQRRATIEHTMTVLLDQVTRFPELERVFLSMALRDPDVARLQARMEALSVGQVAQLIESITSRAQIPDPEAMAYVIHTAVVECAVKVAGFRGRPPLSRERAQAALTDMVYRALFGA